MKQKAGVYRFNKFNPAQPVSWVQETAREAYIIFSVGR